EGTVPIADCQATEKGSAPFSSGVGARHRCREMAETSTSNSGDGATAAVSPAVDAVYRSDWGRIVATLIRLFGDFDVAEEAAQEAFAIAVDQWRAAGIPASPRAWLIQTARHKAIDRIRRRARHEAT